MYRRTRQERRPGSALEMSSPNSTVSASRMPDNLQVLVGQKRPGETVRLTIQRDNKPMTVPVTLEALGGGKDSEVAGGQQGKGRWGLGLADLTPDVRNQLQAESSVHGAIVEQVQPGSPADNAGLQRGDVIMEVNRHPVKSASDVAQALSSVPSGQDALVLVWSQGGSTFRVLHPAEKQSQG